VKGLVYANPFFIKLKQMRKVTIYDYLATNVPSDAFEVISEGSNMPKPKNSHELSAQIKTYVTKNGETGLLRLAEIHPDRELIEAISVKENKENKTDNFSNLSGNLSDKDKEYVNTTKLLMVGGFILVSLAIIMTKK
jgi:hypothetical protein